MTPRPSGLGGDFVGQFGLALVAALWAYKGFESSTFNAGETKDPSRTIPLGLIAGCGLVTLLYILTNIAYLYAVPAADMAGSERIAADAMNAAVGPVGASLVAFIILFSILGAANGHILTGPRVYYAMAKDGLFFRRMAEIHPRFRTPHVSLLTVGAWSIALSLGPSGKFEEMLKFAVFGAWIFLGLAVLGVFILTEEAPRPAAALQDLGLSGDAGRLHPGGRCSCSSTRSSRASGTRSPSWPSSPSASRPISIGIKKGAAVRPPLDLRDRARLYFFLRM